MRIRVIDVLELMAAGLSYSEILEEMPDLEQDDLRAVAKYAARRLGLLNWQVIERAAREAEEFKRASASEKDAQRASVKEVIVRLRAEMRCATRSLNRAAAGISLKKIFEIREQFFAEYSEPI